VPALGGGPVERARNATHDVKTRASADRLSIAEVHMPPERCEQLAERAEAEPVGVTHEQRVRRGFGHHREMKGREIPKLVCVSRQERVDAAIAITKELLVARRQRLARKLRRVVDELQSEC